VVLEGAVVRYRRVTVLDEVSVRVVAGERVAVSGGNGSGKTTLLRLLANLFRPNRGRRVGPRRSAFVPAALEPPPLTVGRWLASVARPARSGTRVVADALDRFGFDGSLSSRCRSLSFGNFRKLVLAEALTSGASLLVIDEATAGLDDPGIAALDSGVGACCARGAAVVLADQGSAPRLEVDRQLIVGGGGVTEVAATASRGASQVVVSLVGPTTTRPVLVRAAMKLGYTPIADEDHRVGVERREDR
jgi:ABC-type multidrug transport system ATPase subunit